jgi:hypothetical protein
MFDLTRLVGFFNIGTYLSFYAEFSMAQLRDNRLSHLTRHAVTTQILCLHLPAGAATMCAMIVKVAPGKEAAP